MADPAKGRCGNLYTIKMIIHCFAIVVEYEITVEQDTKSDAFEGYVTKGLQDLEHQTLAEKGDWH